MKPTLSKEYVTESDESGREDTDSPPPDRQISDKTTDKLQSPAKKAAVAETARNQDGGSSGSESGSESESESQSESSSEEEAVPQKQSSQGPARTKDKAVESEPATASIPAKPFTPPNGYRPAQKHSSESADISKSPGLEGKQVWHITAPVGVPVRSIRELALDAVATGQPVLSHKGKEYRLREDQLGAEKTKVLLLPDKHGKSYRRHKPPVAQTFHVEQIVDTPNNATLSDADTESMIQRLSKPLPSKPKHLRMRYKPFGSVDSAPETRGSSPEGPDKEGMDFQERKSVHIDRDAKKRKHTDPDVEGSKTKRGVNVESDTKGDSPRKRVKKAHAQSRDGAPNAGDDSSHPSARTVAHEAEPRGRERTHDHSTGHKKSAKRKEETSQERRARKQDRKRQKREKESATAI